jgi:hypothetical protein
MRVLAIDMDAGIDWHPIVNRPLDNAQISLLKIGIL